MNRRQQLTHAIGLPMLVFLAIAACTTIGHAPPPDGWPTLKVTKHFVSNREMRDVCVKYTGVGESPMACSEIDLKAGTCDIWLSKDFPVAFVEEHEDEHCKGRDHPGGHFIIDLIKAWRGGL